MSNSEKPTNPVEPKGRGASRSAGSSDTPDSGSMLGSLVRVERLIQLALALPAATFIGWAVGLGLDHWLHRTWIAIAGLLFGAVAGFIEIFRVVAAMSKE